MPKDLTVSLLFDLYGSALGERQREIFTDYYDNDLSLAEIAENCGITRQGVRDYIKRAEEHLRAWEDRLHLLQRLETQDAAAREMLALCRTLPPGETADRLTSLARGLLLWEDETV